MRAHFENLKLVREQGAPEHDGYNPIAPRSHRWMMDADELEETRIFGGFYGAPSTATRKAGPVQPRNGAPPLPMMSVPASTGI